MRRRLNHDDLNAVAQLLLPYHDETIAQSKPKYTERMSNIVEHYMELAAKLAGFTIGAECKSGVSWLEAH